MTSHVMDTYGRLPMEVAAGQGVWLIGTDGRKYFDAISGIGVCALGHAHPEVAAAISEQAARLVHCSNLVTIPQQEALANELARLSGLDRVFFSNSGAEALECAFKIARRHGHQRGIELPQTIVLDRSFHGRTLACISAGASPRARVGFAPLVEGFIRAKRDDLGAISRLASERDDVVAVLLEPIQGEGGVLPMPPGALSELRRICDQHGMLLMLDEVQCGIGRSGRFYAYQHDGILPDVVCSAKALANGVPIGACLARESVAALLDRGSHGSTFGGNPLSCAAGLKVLEIIERDRLIERAAVLGERLLGQLADRLGGREDVVDIRGRGLMVGVEMREPCTHLTAEAMSRGTILNVTRESVIRLLPPLISSEEEIDQLANLVCDLVS